METKEWGITLYKGFRIKEIDQSADGRGRHDYFISWPANPKGVVRMQTTLPKIKEQIDFYGENLI